MTMEMPARLAPMDVSLTGPELLRDPVLNKGTAFSEAERDAFGLHGLLPPHVGTLEGQIERRLNAFRAEQTPFERYVFLRGLQDTTETLFYALLTEHLEEMLPIVYTPTVGEGCERFSAYFSKPRGLFISWPHRHRIEQILSDPRLDPVEVIVVSDGERILGLGDQGAGGMGIPIGKLCLYTLCAGIPPSTTLPVMLDVGTENAERLADPLYLGLRRRRVRGGEYQAFVDEFVEAVRTRFPRAVLQWEDFLKENAITQLERFRDRLCSFNDDIQGTAAVAVAGMLAALRVTGGRPREQRLVLAGAGASAHGIAELFVAALVADGLSERDAKAQVWTTDRSGLVVRGRAGLEGFKQLYARDPEELASWSVRDRGRVTLEEVVRNARATLLVGTSTTPGLFDEPVVRAMGEASERPAIFPLSNPTSKAECMPADALRWTAGRAIVATGSPFAPVELDGRRHRIGQCNNTFVFPGVGLGAWYAGARRISDAMFLDAARALAEAVSPQDLAEGSVFPSVQRIRPVSHAVACRVIRRAVQEGQAQKALLEDLEERVRAVMWVPEYLPLRYEA